MDETLWLCPSRRHVLGIVVRGSIGKGVLLFRHAIPLEDFDAVPKQAIGTFFGRANVECSICGRTRTWYPGARELRRQLRDVRARPDELPLTAGSGA